MKHWGLIIVVVIAAGIAFSTIAFADHGHHRHPGHQKLRKVVCILMADEAGDKDAPDFPDIGC